MRLVSFYITAVRGSTVEAQVPVDYHYVGCVPYYVWEANPAPVATEPVMVPPPTAMVPPMVTPGSSVYTPGAPWGLKTLSIPGPKVPVVSSLNVLLATEQPAGEGLVTKTVSLYLIDANLRDAHPDLWPLGVFVPQYHEGGLVPTSWVIAIKE